jgi:hypothetical protein
MLNSLRGTVGGLARVAAVAFVLCVAVSSATPGAATGDASATTVQLDASTDRVAVSETTTVRVVVDDVDGGVGAYDLVVGLSDPSVATITDVRLVGDPGLQTVNVSSNGSRARLNAALLDTDDAGTVTIATVTLSGVAPGTTDVSLSVSALGAEDGSRYPVESRSASVTVADATTTPADTAGGADSASDDAAGGTTTDAADGTVTDVPEDADDAAAATPDAADGSAESVPNVSPIPFGVGGISAWAVGAVLAALAAALFAARRIR